MGSFDYFCFISFKIYFVYQFLIRYKISKYFPHSEGYLFCLEDTICSTKDFHFNAVQFIHFFSLFTFLGVISEKLLPNSRSSNLLLHFLLKSFIVLNLTFRSIIHFDLLFVWCEVRDKVHSFACKYLFVPVFYVLKAVLFPTETSWYLCQKQLTVIINIYFCIVKSIVVLLFSC